jgi:signal transduction histidine kinase
MVIPPNGRIELSYQQNDLSIEFAALDYHAPGKNQYVYRMEGVDRDWVSAGTRRYVTYANLNPGNYVFRAKGSNNDGVWNEEGVTLHITIWPPFWGTWWFRGLVGVLLVGAALGAYRLRVRSIEARSRKLEQQVADRTAELSQANKLLEQEIAERRRTEEALAQERASAAVSAERNRLARELHDAVTQTLFSASLVAEALPAAWEKDTQEGHGLLQDLRSLSRGALAEMRTLLLELRPAALLETRLDDLLRQLGEAASGRVGIPVTVQIEGETELHQGALPPDVHITLYRITQEALNNVIKHARAHQATVQLCYCPESQVKPMHVVLSISDDGRGFDPTQLQHNRLGLGIMQERVQAIGGTLSIESQPGHGTRVTILWQQTKK